MKPRIYCLFVTLALLATLNIDLATAHAQGTAFTYQGRLQNSGSPATGLYDFRFALSNAPSGGSQIGVTVTNLGVGVTNGLFTTTLDFGAVFGGQATWLAISVRTNGAGSYLGLTPLQPLTPAPYAVFANTASNLSGTLPATQLTGTPGAAVNFTGTLNGGVTGSQNATVVSIVGGQSAANVAGGAVAANAATSANTASAIVKRDASGNFSAGTISASFSGNGAGLTNIPASGVSGLSATATAPPGMVLIPAGVFTMGDTLDGLSDALPTNITVSAFYMDMNLVSYAQWQSVYFWATNQGYSFVNPGLGRAANQPVQTVDWYDAVKWCNARAQQAGLVPAYYTDAGFTQVFTNGDSGATVYMNLANNGYRLPTEAEWEKAARGRLSGQRFPWGNIITENLANYYGSTGSYSYDLGPDGSNSAFTNGVSPYTGPAGYFAPNDYGLYDMAGNVEEWCWDWYGTTYGQPGNTNPTGPATGSYRVLRGGSWSGDASYARCANRDIGDPAGIFSSVIGFRCVRGH